MTHICVGNLAIIGSDNGLSPGRRQAYIWTNAGILLMRPLGTNFSEMLIEIHIFSFKKMHFKWSSGKWRSFCPGLDELRRKMHLYFLTSGTLSLKILQPGLFSSTGPVYFNLGSRNSILSPLLCVRLCDIFLCLHMALHKLRFQLQIDVFFYVPKNTNIRINVTSPAPWEFWEIRDDRQYGRSSHSFFVWRLDSHINIHNSKCVISLCNNTNFSCKVRM